MTISQALSNANSGLVAASTRAKLTANNISNALTEGYSRRDVSFSERPFGGGVQLDGISRATNAAITLERRGAEAEFARSDAEATAIERVTDYLGEPEDPNSLFAKYEAFESALSALADQPDDAILQEKVLLAAQGIADTFNDIADDYQTVRLEADQAIAADVDTANSLLVEIDRLNEAIADTAVIGGASASLEDERAILIDQLNEIIPVREVSRDHGVVDIMTPEGVFLLTGGEPRTLNFSAANATTTSTLYSGGTGVLSGITVDGLDITPNGPGVQQISEGSIAGHFAVRDEIVPQMSDALDALAYDLISRLSDSTVDTTLTAGNPGLFTDGGAAGALGNLNGMASRIAVNDAVDPDAGGELYRIRDGIGATAAGPVGSDTLLRGLIGLMDSSIAQQPELQTGRSLTAAEAVAHVTSFAASALVSANTNYSASEILVERLVESEKQETAVDTDTELQNLLLIEQAYAANAQIVETINAMFDSLFEALR